MWILAVNPTSGKGRGATFGREIAGILRTRDIPYQLVTANSAGQMSQNLKNALETDDEITGIISVGGDGLAHLVLQHAVPQSIPIAPIPAGTGNDWVRTLGWDLHDVDVYVETVLTRSPTKIDLGLVDGEWFANILSTGFDSVVNERANRLRWPSGPARYNVAIALELPFFKPRSYQLRIDGHEYEKEAMLIAIANGASYGGGMKVAPDANIHDGLFDVMLLKPVSKVEFLKVFPRVYSGSHLNHHAVEIVRGRHIELSAQAVAYADGERIGQLPVRAECVQGAGLTWLS